MATEQDNPFDITIIGGGMVGASLALLLSSLKLDWRIRVVEAVATPPSGAPAQPSFDARSTALSHSSREIFELLGLWDQLQAGVAAIDEVHVSDRGHIGTTRLSAQEQKLPALGYVVENRHLGAALMAAVQQTPAIDWLAPARVTAVQARREGVNLTVSLNGQDTSASFASHLLVVADGAQSHTRELLGISASSKDYGQMAIVANISLY